MSDKGRHVEVFTRKDGDWGFRLIGGNGEPVTQSEGYSGDRGKQHAIRAADTAHPGVDIWVEGKFLRPEGEVLGGPGPYPGPVPE